MKMKIKIKNIFLWFAARKKNLFISLAVTFVILVFLALIFDTVIMPVYTKHGAEKELPDVTELSFDEAKAVLETSGFRIVKEREMFEATYPESTIIQQHPLPYSRVKKGRRIYVTISAGEKPVEVPDVVGISERDAYYALRTSGLDPEMPPYFEYDNYRPRGVVCRQSIPAGTNVMENTKITITISNGPMPTEFVVPDLTGRSLETAQKLLRQNGLILGIIEYRVKKDLIPNTVIEQTIKAGKHVEKGQPVSIVLSKLEEDSWE